MIVALAIPGFAAPVERAVQAEIYPQAFDFAADQLTTTPFEFGPYDFSTYYDCYYELDVSGFNLEVEIDSVDVELENGSLAIDVRLGQVRGENIDVSGISGWFDVCIDFDTTIQYLELQDGRIQGTLVADPTADGGVRLSFAGEPELWGTFDSQIEWFPDDIVWAFFGDLVLDEIGAFAADALPGLLEDPISGVFDSPLGDLQLSARISDLDASRDGLFAAADIDLGGDGDGSGPTLDVGPRGDSHFGVALSDGLVRDVVGVAWDGGVLSGDSPATAALVDDLVATLGLPEDVETSLGLDEDPAVTIDGDGVALELPRATLEAWDGDEQLLRLVVDLGAVLEPDVDPALGDIVLSAHDVSIDVEELDAEHLVQDQEGEDHLRDFLQGWVAEAVSSSLEDVPVFGSRFGAWGYVLRLDELELQDEGVATWFTVFDADDPAVDLVAPDTWVKSDGRTVEFGGVDDRDGPLSYAWRVDGGAWSVWTAEARARLPEQEPGKHVVEAIARDGWQNEDLSPASATFTVDRDAREQKKGCGCASGGPGVGGLGALVAALAGLRRRSPRG